MTDKQGPIFHPEAVQVSKLHFYSLGIIAANKTLSSDIVEVTPIEELTMLDGEISSDQVSVENKGKDALGGDYTTNVQTANSIKAKWLKIGVGNRLTSPDVRRGAHVVIYQFGDSDNFYWTTLQDDSKLRKLETVIWGFSGTKSESDTNSSENMYYLELSTHTGLVAFHTSNANGEFCTYDFQFNTKEGQVVLRDSIGNWFMLDSKQHTLHLENVDGSIIDITKQIATVFTKDQINMETKTYSLKATTGNVDVTSLNENGSSRTVNYGSNNWNGNSNWTAGSFVVTAANISLNG